jgi:hypothetical protein
MEDDAGFSPQFLDAQGELLAYAASLRATADDIEATVATYRAYVSEHAGAGS